MQSFVAITILGESGLETVQITPNQMDGTDRFLFSTDGQTVFVWDMDVHPDWNGDTPPDGEVPSNGFALLSDGTFLFMEYVEVVIVDILVIGF